ncbi:hypothetical protein C1H46_023187 [Malus baccata]|uniref:Sey1/RHD3-like three-helix bundle domain-containing protein n=1 Tax=Malus baccata TaxID=106549 RepID=A0A540LXN7_MALBA|nr:hypothetical protein C1H46_023187 [Malus baccata]
MMRLFSPRKTTLLFVIRDKTKIWDGVPKPQAHKSTPLSEFFTVRSLILFSILWSFLLCIMFSSVKFVVSDTSFFDVKVEVVALSSYEEKEEKFKEEVAQLRQRFFHSISPGGLAGDRRGVVPASGFSFSAQQIWKVIKENKDLDLPAHKVMVATVRCEEIANQKFKQLVHDEFVYPAYSAMLGHLRSKALEDFQVRLEQSLNKGEGFASSVRTCAQSSKLEFEKGCADAAIQQANWVASKAREKLRRDIDAHASSVRSAKLAELNSNYEKKLSSSLSGPVEALLETGAKDTWALIRKLLNRETEVAVSKFSTAVANFELDNETVAKMKQHLKDYARNVVETKAREEAGKIMIHMKDRFARVFNYDSDSMPRVWTGNEDIKSITKDARTASLKLLSTMAAIRLDEKPDNIENVLVSSLVDGTVTVSSSKSRKLGPSTDPLASSSWEEVSSKDTLITPVQCKSLWRQFKAETEYSVTQAISAQLSGILSISSRFLPTVMNLLRKLAEEPQGNQTPEEQRRPVSLSSQSYRNETPRPNPVTSSFPESSVSSNISSSDTGMECSSPPLRQRRTANVEEVESS